MTLTRRPLILVADDSPSHRAATVAMLERSGFDVIAAADGGETIDLVRRHPPDIIVIELMMPVLSGFETIAALRADSEMSTIPTIVVSGLDDIQSRLDAFAIGADDFITKPVNPAELVARVRAQLRIVEAWNLRVGSMLDRFNQIRHDIADSERCPTPAEAARALQLHLPTELTCTSIAVFEPSGQIEWTALPWSDEIVDRLGSTTIAAGQSTVIAGSSDGVCPLCGRRAQGEVLAANAGEWGNGRAVLLAGCIRPGDERLRATVREVAWACESVLGERLRQWAADSELTTWLASVIDRRAFDVHFQPIVDLHNGRVRAQEALARFHDGTSPGQVFQTATLLARRVELELALVEMAVTKGAALPNGVKLHVNVSPMAAVHPSLGAIIAKTRRRVVLEIAEQALSNAGHAQELRDNLPSNCALAADDVGAGQASLSRLLEYRPDVVKIDRAIVMDLDHDPAHQALVAGLVQFTTAAGGTLIAEGIERREEAETLLALGVSEGQGYYFGRPLPLFEASQIVYCVPTTSEPQRSLLRRWTRS
jgi:EAL domain-containing protein (putative c-di-GMP-specific phosphodiesterase class I)/CheY-like chemotaxis protein